jgi:hypothetical protein
MKIDLIFVGAALCGRPFEEPTEGLPYNYGWERFIFYLRSLDKK